MLNINEQKVAGANLQNVNWFTVNIKLKVSDVKIIRVNVVDTYL